jgi:hypothetical protein
MRKATRVLEALLNGREVTLDGYWSLVLNEDFDLCHVVVMDDLHYFISREEFDPELGHHKINVNIGSNVGWFVRFCNQFADDEIEEAINAQAD